MAACEPPTTTAPAVSGPSLVTVGTVSTLTFSIDMETPTAASAWLHEKQQPTRCRGPVPAAGAARCVAVL
jgi:hypothetical protein